MEKIKQLACADRLQKYITYEIGEKEYLGVNSVMIEFTPRYHNCNLYGHCHGGILMTIADNCMYATYCYYLENSGIVCLPIPQVNIVYTKDMSYDFKRNALVDRKIIFIGTVDKEEGIVDCIVKQDDKVIGNARGKYILIRRSNL